MNLREELGRNSDFTNMDVEILVSAAYLSKSINRLSIDFFSRFKVEQDGKTYGVTDMQFNALVILFDRRDQNTLQTELAERLVINKSSAGTLIDKLEERKWINRVAKDRRANYISITENGIKVLELVAPEFDAACSVVVKQFSQKDKELFLNLLSRYRSQIQSFNDEIR